MLLLLLPTTTTTANTNEVVSQRLICCYYGLWTRMRLQLVLAHLDTVSRRSYRPESSQITVKLINSVYSTTNTH